MLEVWPFQGSIRLEADEDVEVFSNAPNVEGDEDPENPGKFTPPLPPPLPLTPTLV